MTKRTALGLTLLASFGAWAWARPLWSSPESAVAAPHSTPLTVSVIEARAVDRYTVEKEYTGLLRARRVSEIGFERAGRIESIAFEEGAEVEADTPLAILDHQRLLLQREELQARRAQAAATLNELQNGPRREQIAAARARVEELGQQLELLRLQTQRRERLLENGDVSTEIRDEFAFGETAARARLDTARHQLEELENGTRSEVIEAQSAAVRLLDAQLASLALEIERSTLKAPFDGTLVERSLDEGAVVPAGQPVFRLLEHARLEARVGLPIATAEKLDRGQPLTLQIGSHAVAAELQVVLPDLDPVTRTRTAVFELDAETSRQFVAGQAVRLSVEEELPTQGFWLPLNALTKGERGLWACFVVLDEDRVERRELEVLHTEAKRVLVRGTLQQGESIIAGGVDRIVNGQSVQPVEL